MWGPAVRSRISLRLLLPLFVLASSLAVAQRTPSQLSPIEITGDVRIDGRPAPPGVLVLLDFSSSQNSPPVGTGELGRTMTDSGGRFKLAAAPADNPGRRLVFAVTAHYPGYSDASAVLDLTSMPRGHVMLDMHRDTSKDVPSVPPGGPAATISARQPASSEAKEALVKGRELLLEKHDVKGSIESLKKALKHDPNFAPTYILLGAAYVQT